MDSRLIYCVYWNQGQKLRTHGVKSLDRFNIAMLPCPTVMLSCKHEFKVYQHNGYFSSDSAASGLWSDSLTALANKNQVYRLEILRGSEPNSGGLAREDTHF